jgi:hypothetical protein
MTSLRWVLSFVFALSMGVSCVLDPAEVEIDGTSLEVQCDPGWIVKDGACVAPAFTDIYKSIILTKCKGCHVSKAMGGLSLAKADIAYKNLVDVKADATGPCAKTKMTRVDPGNADGSLFFKKFYKPSLCGQTMPVGGNLAPIQIDQVEAWIADGASF